MSNMKESLKRRKRKPKMPFLTQDEMRKLLSAIKNKRNKAIFLTAYRHGLRPSEVGLLQRTDIDFKQGRIAIERLKGSNAGVFPMQPDLIKLIRSYLRTRHDALPYLFPSNRGVPIDRKTLWYLMRKYGELAGLPKAKQHFHVLKHSIATHLADAGADGLFIKYWLGFENIQNAMIYTELRNPARDTRARQLFISHQVV